MAVGDLLDRGAARPLPAGELEFRFSRAGGPGGQHVNTSSTRVELLFDLAASPTLTEDERARATRRLRSRLDAEGRLRVVAQDERSQMRNRELAIRRLNERVANALRPRKRRRATRATKASQERRLQSKRRRSETKRARRRPAGDD